MKEKTCCFTRHRLINLSEYSAIKRKVKKVMVSLIKKGVIFYGAGGVLGFDTIAAECVLELKEKYPQIKLILVLPCKDQTRGWYDSDIKKYNEILSRADKVVYIAERYYDGCMLKRNRHLVDNSGYCIYYLKRDGGRNCLYCELCKTKLAYYIYFIIYIILSKSNIFLKNKF